MKRLVDTNVLVYLHDPRFPAKQKVAARVLAEGIEDGTVVLPHQALLEFVAAVSRPRPELRGAPLVALGEALREAEDLMAQFPVLYPDASVVRTAVRGTLTYQLPWFDAHLWAHAEVHGASEILSEDFEHGRVYGSVRARDPFLEATGEVHELPALYETRRAERRRGSAH